MISEYLHNKSLEVQTGERKTSGFEADRGWIEVQLVLSQCFPLWIAWQSIIPDYDMKCIDGGVGSHWVKTGDKCECLWVQRLGSKSVGGGGGFLVILKMKWTTYDRRT